MYRLRVETHFDAAHYIKDYQGKCSQEHGHRWIVVAVFEGAKPVTANMVVDFGFVTKVMNNILDGDFDHRQLNESLHESNVTAEFLAKRLYRLFTDAFTHKGSLVLAAARLVSVIVQESPTCSVEYSE